MINQLLFIIIVTIVVRRQYYCVQVEQMMSSIFFLENQTLYNKKQIVTLKYSIFKTPKKQSIEKVRKTYFKCH